MLPSELVNYKKKSRKIIALTAWDSISGSIAEQANVDLVLVGDSLAMVCLGYKSTLPLTLENIIYHTNAVSRGFKKKIEEYGWKFVDEDLKDKFFEENKENFRFFGRDVENLFLDFMHFSISIFMC